MIEQINNLCNNIGFHISEVTPEQKSCALGLGDILRLLACLKYDINNYLCDKIYINIASLTYYSNPINYINFRLQLIKNVLKCNNIDSKKVVFFYNKINIEYLPNYGQTEFVKQVDCNKIQHLKLDFDTSSVQPCQNNAEEKEEKEEYIIFHTKSRFHLDKENVFQDLKVFEKFISTFKSKYKIYIIGERQINRNNTEVLHSPDIITQIYNILINLSNNNDVIDQTVEMLVDNLDYNNFVKDVQLIQNAKYNIHFGDGGSMNYSMIFGKHTTIIYNRDMEEWDKCALQQENTFICNNINDFLNKLQTELAANELGDLKPELRPLQKKEELNFVFNKLYNNPNKSNKNAYFLCHCGLGDFFFMNGAIRFLSLFYNKIYLFCPKSVVKNMQISLYDVNVEFITFNNWYEKINQGERWPKLSEDWYKTAAPFFYYINNQYENQYEMFDWKKYINIYNDLSSLINNKVDAWHHWENYGKAEGRQFCIAEEYFFDWQTYIQTYPDLSSIHNKKDALHHWNNHGKYENRNYFKIDVDINSDFFVSAETFHKSLHARVSQETIEKCNVSSFNNKITNENFLNYNQINYWKTPYYFLIPHFYNSINLNMSIYYDYFYIPSTSQSWELYKQIKDYKIVFLHFTSSCGETHIPDNEWPHIYNEEYLIINPDKNHYNLTDSHVKYDLANQYLQLLSVDYIDVLLHASDIYVCDSSFASMIFPLRMKELLKADNFIIYDRYYPGKPANIPVPVNLSRNK